MRHRGRCRALLGVVCGAATLSCAAAGSNVSALYNVSSRVHGLDAAQAIVTWPLKADHSPVGVVMAGGTLGNADVLAKATGDDGALDQWKAKSKAAAKAAMDEVMEEVMEDDPDSARLGMSSSMYKELQDVAAKARKLTVKVPNIGDGGAASTAANAKAEAQAEAAAIMAASEAGVVDSYDMPAPPEAANDAPFARRKRTAGVVRAQKRVVSGRPTRTRAIGPSGTGVHALKVLAKSRRAKGPSRHALAKRGATASEGVSGALKRALSAPLARVMSLLEEDPDAPTEAEAKLAEDKPPCAVGTTGPDGGPCELCPKDTYKDVEGSDACSACPDGTRTARVGTTSLEDCWDGPMDLESPLGMVMAGPKLADPDVQNKSLSSEAMGMWKARVGGASKEAVKEVVNELLDDDLLGVKGNHEEAAKELNTVVAEARSLTHGMGAVDVGGDAALSAKLKAEAQADAVAFMMSHKAVIADAYSDDDSANGPLVRKGEILYPFGHHNMHKERGEEIGYPGGNRPYYARMGEEEHVGVHPDSSVHGSAHAYYDAARRVGSAGVRQTRMLVQGPARLQSLDALWEGIPPGSDGSEVPQNVWIGAVAGESPAQEQVLEHNLQHQFLAANNGPVSLGTVATGSSNGAAGAAFTGVSDSTVWHSSWIASSDASIADPSSKISGIQASSTPKYSKASKAGDRIAKQEAAALTPPGSGMRGPPLAKHTANAQTPTASGCTSDQIDLCRAGCDSKLHLEIVSDLPEAKDKWKKNCISKCLGPCAKELGYEVAKAEKEIENLFKTTEDKVLEKTMSQQAASVASDAIKRLEKKAGLGSGSWPQAASATGKAGVWHYTPGAAPAASPSSSGAMPFPAPQAHTAEPGSQTGVYDCTGQALVVGSIVGRMIPGRACEDQYLVVSAGMWKVTDYKQPGAAEKVEMRHGANVQGRVGVVLHGITDNVNKGTRVELVPFVGAFTHWKLIRGPTKDLFLPANMNAILGRGHHNKAGVDDPSGFTAVFHKQKAKRAKAAVDKSGVSQSESVFSMQAQRQNDWGDISNIEKQDHNLAMCPGPSCPTDGPSQQHRIMHLGNPFWKYVIVAVIVGSILAYQYLKRVNEGVVPAGVLQQEYVQLPSMFGGGGGGGGDGVELKSKGGTRPCPGMKGSDRIVMVENASDRIIMVDVGGGGSSQRGAGAGDGGASKDGDTASKDVGYQ